MPDYVRAWWVEASSGDIVTHTFTALPQSGSYESEVHLKHAVNAELLVLQYLDRHDQTWMHMALAPLHARSAEIKATKGAG